MVGRSRLAALIIGLSLALGAVAADNGKAPVKGVGEFETPDWFKVSFLNLPEDARAAEEADKHLLLFWYQDGCPYCDRLINRNFSQKRIADYTREHFDVVALNLWGSRDVTGLHGREMAERALGRAMGVRFTPTVLFVDGDGAVVQRLNGYYPPRRFLAALRYVAEGNADSMALSAYLKENLGKRGKGQGPAKLIDEPFFAEPPFDLSEKDGPVAVFFEQPRCWNCRILHENILAEGLTRNYMASFHAIQLDRWGNTPVVTPAGERLTAKEWADQLGIDYVPAIVLFNEGEEIIRMASMLRGFHVRSMLAYVATGAYWSYPRFQRYLQQRNEWLREWGITVDLWETD